MSKMIRRLIRTAGIVSASLILASGVLTPLNAEEIQTEPAMAAQNVTVSASADAIRVSVPALGSGMAQLYACDADEYFSGDAMTGLSENKGAVGETVAEFDLGAAQELTLARYGADGTDNIYKKYYVIQSGSIVSGPFYASDIASQRDIPSFPMNTKKGITSEDWDTISTAVEIGASNTVINMDLGQLILANEDAAGNPVDHSGEAGVIPFVSNGTTYYFDAKYVAGRDSRISAYSREGINVTLVVIAMNRTDLTKYPSALVYPGTSNEAETMAFNTSNEKGRNYWIAAMEFLADRYSSSADAGLVDKYVIGNEVDYTYDWYLIIPQKDADGRYTRAEFNTFMEEYARTVRLANQAIKKYNASAKAAVSITHSWAVSRQNSYRFQLDNTYKFYNSYAPKEMLDWMNSVEKGRGDYDWCISSHPYPVGTTPSNPTATDLNPPENLLPVTGDWRNTPWITSVNLELYQQYLEQPQNTYNGQVREVILTETSICNLEKDSTPVAEYEKSICEQAASVAQYYYRAANVDCITEIAYFKLHDSENYNLGLIGDNGEIKPAFTVWKYVDTNISFDIANRYLPYITAAKSYKDIMDLTRSGYDWNSKWKESNIIRRTVEPEKADRLAGADRFDTSIKIAEAFMQEKKIDKLDSVILANGINFADALAGSYLSYVKDAPILITWEGIEGYRPYEQINTFIKKNVKEGGTIYVLGGEEAVKPQTLTGLEKFNIKRLAGDNRFETNLKILEETRVSDQDILVATGMNFADSLSASAVNRPILLVWEQLFDMQKDYLKTLKGNDYYLLGGEKAVTKDIAKELAAYGKVERLAGSDRHETSVLIAETFCPDAESAVLALSTNFPDGLCGGPLASATNAPLILTIDAAKALAETHCRKHGIFGGYVLGGEGLVSDPAVQNIFYTKKVNIR